MEKHDHSGQRRAGGTSGGKGVDYQVRVACFYALQVYADLQQYEGIQHQAHFLENNIKIDDVVVYKRGGGMMHISCRSGLEGTKRKKNLIELSSQYFYDPQFLSALEKENGSQYLVHCNVGHKDARAMIENVQTLHRKFLLENPQGFPSYKAVYDSLSDDSQEIVKKILSEIASKGPTYKLLDGIPESEMSVRLGNVKVEDIIGLLVRSQYDPLGTRTIKQTCLSFLSSKHTNTDESMKAHRKVLGSLHSQLLGDRLGVIINKEIMQNWIEENDFYPAHK